MEKEEVEVPKKIEEKEEEVEQEEREDEEEDEEEDEGILKHLPKLEEEERSNTNHSKEERESKMRKTAEETDRGPQVGVAMPTYENVEWYPEVVTEEREREERREEREEGQEGIAMVAITQDQLFKDQKRIQEELAHEIKAPPSSISTSFGGRRKHQLSTMAFEQASAMERYEMEAAAARRNKREVYKKYGW